MWAHSGLGRRRGSTSDSNRSGRCQRCSGCRLRGGLVCSRNHRRAHCQFSRSKFSRALRPCASLQLPRQRLRLTALGSWHILIHLRQCIARLRQARTIRQRHQGIGAHPIERGVIRIEVRQAENILRARIAAIRCGADHRHRLVLLAFLKQHQPVIVGSLDMAKPGCLFIELARAGIISLDPAPKAIGLRQVEQRIGIASRRGALPFSNRAGKVARRPSVDPCFDIRQRRASEQRQCGDAQPRAGR